MRPIRSLYLWCAPVVLSATLGCGKDGPTDNGDHDAAPTADFSSACSALSCGAIAFTSGLPTACMTITTALASW